MNNIPCSLDINVFKAYFNIESLPKQPKPPNSRKRIQTFNLDWNILEPKSLRRLALDSIIENWIETPYFHEIPRQVDRNYILDHLDPNIPLKVTSAHIKEDFFWRKSYQHRWKLLPPDADNRPWINIYMEKHLQEYIENTEVYDYDQESVQVMLEVCAPYINKLQIDYLQASTGERNDHIPLDFVLSNLPELRSLRVTYCTRTIGTNFYLGCSALSRNDILSFSRGLNLCSELTKFCLHSVKLEPFQLGYISKALDKGCQHLAKLVITHCTVHDDGLQQFLNACTKESFAGLRKIDLTGNFISSEGAYTLSRSLRGRPLEKLIVRLNPIGSGGAAAIFSIIRYLPIQELDISGCSISNTITKLLMHLIVENQTMTKLDISNNILGEDVGEKVYKIIGFNKILNRIDLRNTGVTMQTRSKIKNVLKGHTPSAFQS